MNFNFDTPPASAAADAPSSTSASSSSSSRTGSSSSLSGAPRASIKSVSSTAAAGTLKRAARAAELSHSKREQNFNKRRRGHEQKIGGEEDVIGAGGEGEKKEENQTAQIAWSNEQIQALLTQFHSCYLVSSSPPNPSSQAILPNSSVSSSVRSSVLRSLRSLLSNDDAPIGLVVAAGVVPALVCELSAPAGAEAEGETATRQMDAIWCLTNIASDTTSSTRAVLPAAPALISFLSSASITLREQCVWCLGNIAAEEQDCRRQLIDNGILIPLMRLLAPAVPPHNQLPPLPLPIQAPTDKNQLSLVRVAMWTLSNLIKTTRSTTSKMSQSLSSTSAAASASSSASSSSSMSVSDDAASKHSQAFSSVSSTLLPLLCCLLRSSDAQLATETSWTLAAWANHSDGTTEALFREGLIPAILARMDILQKSPLAKGEAVVVDAVTGVERDPLASALIPLVRLIGNAAHANDQIINAILTFQFPQSDATTTTTPPSPPPSPFFLFFSTLDRSLCSLHRGLKKEVCWVLSNLAATALPAVHQALLLNERGEPSVFLHRLLHLAQKANFDLQRESVHALYNLCRCAQGRFMHLVLPRHTPPHSTATQCILRVLFDFLRSRDPDATLLALRFIELALSTHPDAVRITEEEGGIDALEQVQQHCENASLVAKAQEIVDRFYGAEEENEIEPEEGESELQSDMPAWRVQQQTPPKQAQGEQAQQRFQF